MANEFGGNREKVIQVILPNYVKTGGDQQCLQPSAEKNSKVQELYSRCQDISLVAAKFLLRLNEINGGCEKILPVSLSF